EITPLEGLKEACGDDIGIVYRPTAMSESLEPIPAANLWTDESKTARGLKASIYTNREFTGSPAITRIDKQVNFSWQGGAPEEGFNTDNFAIRWEGCLVVEETGQYVLAVSSDDGSRLYLNDRLLTESWRDHSEQVFRATVQLDKGKANKIKVEFFENSGDAACKLLWSPMLDRNRMIQENVELASSCDAVIIFAGINHSYESEGDDKPDMLLPHNQQMEINAIAEKNPNVIVALINGSPVEIGEFVDNVPALIEAWYPGQLGGRALAEIIFGDVNPSGKLPVTLPKRLADTPAIKLGEYPGKDGAVKHTEEIYIGYRYYDTMDVEPEFPFGHGLSYTAFTYEGINVTTTSPFTATVKVTVRNTGNVAGKEVVQLYVTDEKCSLDRPEKELKGFEKISLKPKQAKTVTFTLDKSAFSFYNPESHSWEVENGSYKILVGSSSRDIRREATLSFSIN
ncbi:MAG: glycoside hydrolase family 3 C-terminal domain-containing protein, partial [Phycisphaerae bacterium]